MVTQFKRFLAGGAVATLLHWAVMAALIGLGAMPPMATAVGAGMGLLANYLAQHRYTFRSRQSHQTAFPRYVSAAATGWLVNLVAFVAMQRAGAALIAAQLAATAIATAINFFLARRFVFDDWSYSHPE